MNIKTIVLMASVLGVLTFLALSGCKNAWMEEILNPPQKTTENGPVTQVYCKVTFESNEGSNVEQQMVPEGGTATRPDNPNKEGFGFVNWYSNVNLNEPPYDFNTPVTADITLYAKWSADFFTVYFAANGGSPEPLARDVGEGGILSEPAEMERSGWVFDGWYTDDNTFINQWDFANDRVYEEMTLYAKWITLYTVTFNTNDGGLVESQLVRGGEKATRPFNPEKPGFGFIDWYTDNGTFNNAWDFANTAVTEDITLYAKWSDTFFTVKFESNGGSAVASQTVGEGGKASQPDPDPTKTADHYLYLGAPPSTPGFVFDGWYTDDGAFNNAWGFAVDTVSADIILYAKWTSNFIDVSGQSGANDVEKAIAYVNDNAAVGEYTLVVGADVSIGPQTLNSANARLTLQGKDTEKIIQYNGAASDPLFHIKEYATVSLTIKENITLRGITNSSNSLVRVENGTFTMEDGAKITGHETSHPYAAVHLFVWNGEFIMKGGEIIGNKTTNTSYCSAGGVALINDGKFTMSGGSITGNTAGTDNHPADVWVNGGFLALTLSLSETARIGSVFLSTDPSSTAPSITLGGGYNPGVLPTINLTTANTSSSMDGVINLWTNKEILKAVSGYTLTSSDAAKFVLGSFYTDAAPTESQPISYTHMMGTTAADMGCLKLLGTEDYPFAVAAIADLQAVGRGGTGGYSTGKYQRWTLSAYYKQTANINLSGNWTPIGDNNTNNISSRFTGVYDGGGNTITGLNINNPAADNQGLFGYIEGATIENVRLVGVEVKGSDRFGGVVGMNDGGRVRNCSVAGLIEGGANSGGVVGANENGGIVENCYSNCSVSGSYGVGGVAGLNKNGSTVRNCYATGDVLGNSSGWGTGGVVGNNEGNNSIVQNCYSTGAVSGSHPSVGNVGGVIGNNADRLVENCVALNPSVNSVSGAAGRIAGGNSDTLTNNHARGDMLVNGAEPVTDKIAAGVNGANVTAASNVTDGNGGYNNQAFWQYTMDWDFGDVWQWNAATNLPILRGFSAGAQNPVVQFVSATGIEMVWIPAGTFTMGCPEDEPGRYSGETQHQVTLTSGFYMGKYPVTQAQYQAVMGTNPSYFATSSDGDNPANRPVETVSWYDAIVFCNKLSMAEGLIPAYRISGSTDPAIWGTVPTGGNNPMWDTVEVVSGSTGYRLPTEAQWEYACRAGTTTAFNWGTDDIDSSKANYDSNLGRTTEVGSYAPNAWGLYDMHGNVWEWCWDWYDGYSSGPQTDPDGAVSGDDRVSRGGSWSDYGQYLRSAYRGVIYPYYRRNYVGFRLVRL